MSHREIDERAIVRLLKSAGRADVSAAEYAAVVARVQTSLPADTHRAIGRRRLVTGVAAAVGVLLIALAAVLVATHPQSAWAELQVAAETSGEFRGWVSLRPDVPNAMPFILFDTERGSRASYEQPDEKGRRPVRFMDHRRGTDSYWSPAAGAVFVSELLPAELEMTYDRYAKQSNIAVDFREQLKNMRSAVGAGDLDVQSKRDDGRARFDVNWYRRDVNGKRESTPADAMSYWVDPKTHLITKVRHARRGQQPVTQVYEYRSLVNDIYDLGVPRDAKLVDRRPTGVLKDLLDALDRRIEAGTGDGVAVVTTVATQQDAANEPVLDTLEIYGRSGDRWVWAQYLVGRTAGRDAVGNTHQQPELAPPADWPNLDPAAAIALVKNMRPDDLFVRDSTRTFRSFKGSGTLATGEPASIQDAAYFGMPGWYWPGRFRLRVYSPWAVASLRQDSDGAETIVVDEMDRAGTRRSASHEITLSKQTGLPTAAVDRVFDDAIERRTERWTFSANLQTPGGITLPRRWTYEMLPTLPDKRSIRKDATLRFDPNTRLPDTWFDPPAKRFGTK